jgi:AcrR family transcriptional regulator
MIKGTPELIEKRREEIVNACEELYQTMSFKEITLKEIGNVTEFSRPTIYNYFKTKEEIFLALFKREYDRWNKDLQSILDDYEALSKEDIADKIAASLQKRTQLLRLLSMNNYEMEANSRPELLTDFKLSYGASLKLFARISEKFCPDMSAKDIEDLIYMFFPFMFGIYPYTAVTGKQRTAMKEANIEYRYQTVYEITYTYLIKLLGD